MARMTDYRERTERLGKAAIERAARWRLLTAFLTGFLLGVIVTALTT